MITIEALETTGTNGAVWGTETEDLNATLVRWEAEKGVAEHTNSEVDVIMTVVEGEGQVTVDEQMVPVRPGSIIVIPKGSTRKILATSENLTYVNVHRRRPKLMPNGVRPKDKLT